MNTALFAGTVFKGTGTRFLFNKAVKIRCFAQSAGNFSSTALGSSETTRADPFFISNAQLGTLVDRGGYLRVDDDNKLFFKLVAPASQNLQVFLQEHFGACLRLSGSTLV